MRKFNVCVLGENILIPVGNGSEAPARGFYVWRFVEADSAKEAGRNALQAVSNDPKLSTANNQPASGFPHLSIEEIREVDSLDPLKPAGSGFIFFSEEPDA